MSKRSVRYTIHFLTAVSITAMVLFVIYGMQNGLFTDRTKMEMLIERGGIFGPLFFIFIQMVQVVVPIIPGGISCAAGAILFGPWMGLLYNYIGIVIGSMINFYLARRYGQCFVKYFVKEETYEKYAQWLEKGKKFDKFLQLRFSFHVRRMIFCVCWRDLQRCHGRGFLPLFYLENQDRLPSIVWHLSMRERGSVVCS